MVGERIASQSEVIRAIVSDYSPYCGVAHLVQPRHDGPSVLPPVVVPEHDEHVRGGRVGCRDEVLGQQDQVVRDALGVLGEEVGVVGTEGVPVTRPLLA